MIEPDPRLFAEPGLGRRACKEHLCPPGEFASVPFVILQRRDLRLGPLKVYVALLDDLRRGGQWVRTTVAKVMWKTQYGRRTVQQHIHWLSRHGFIESREQAGGSNWIAFALPDDLPPDLASAGRAPADPRRQAAPPPAHTGCAPTGTHRLRPYPRTQAAPPPAHTGGAPTEQQGQPRQQQQGAHDGEDAVAEQSRIDQNAKLLRRIGLEGDGVLSRLAATPGLMPLGVALLALEAGGEVRNLAGWVRQRLQDGATGPQRPWGAQQVCEVCRRGWLGDLDGHSLSDRVVKWNEEAVTLREGDQVVAVISTARLLQLAGGSASLGGMRPRVLAELGPCPQGAKRDDAAGTGPLRRGGCGHGHA